MVEVEINKDIKEYSPKLIGPFTTRQAICFTVSGIMSLITYNAIGESIPSDLKMYICFTTAAPGILIGWVKVFGMTFEKFIKLYLFTQVLPPAIRKYKTINTLYTLSPEEKSKEQKEALRRKKAVEKFNRKSKLKPEHKSYK